MNLKHSLFFKLIFAHFLSLSQHLCLYFFPLGQMVSLPGSVISLQIYFHLLFDLAGATKTKNKYAHPTFHF